MTCVLQVTPFHGNIFSGDTVELQNKRCEHFDFDWYIHSGLTNGHTCNTTSTESPVSCRADIPNRLPGTAMHEKFDVHLKEDLTTTCTENSLLLHGEADAKNLFEKINCTHVEPENHVITKPRIKRKAELTETEDVYIPPKRMSPFLNTPKERKDERKNILKISIKKLKQLNDPEIFLRRTVLVNNTMKQLQSEIKAEKLRTKKRKSFSGYGVLNNNCLSKYYAFDDPFLSGMHEKITDDMTDTLIKNVFNDKHTDKIPDSETGERFDKVKNEMDIYEAKLCAVASSEASIDNSNHTLVVRSSNEKESKIDSSVMTC